MDALQLEGVNKRYGSRQVVRDLSLAIGAGTIQGVLGPNGAGKSTLLRMVMGLVKPSAGRIRLLGDLAPGAREARRQLGYMPQALALYPTLSPRENVRFFGRLYAVPTDALMQRTEELLSLVDLRSHADAPVDTLSGGMARRAMLASALIHQPRLLILDEPTAGVDPALRVRFWDWFEHLASDGTTIIVTTHHIAEASRAQRVVFLREGQLIEAGTPEEVMARHGTRDLEAAFVSATRAEGAERAS